MRFLWFSWVTIRGYACQGEVLASTKSSSKTRFTSVEMNRGKAFEYRLCFVAVGWQSELRCLNSRTGASVTTACNTLRFNVNLSNKTNVPPKPKRMFHQNGCSHFSCRCTKTNSTKTKIHIFHAVAWSLHTEWHHLEDLLFLSRAHCHILHGEVLYLSHKFLNFASISLWPLIRSSDHFSQVLISYVSQAVT